MGYATNNRSLFEEFSQHLYAQGEIAEAFAQAEYGLDEQDQAEFIQALIPFIPLIAQGVGAVVQAVQQRSSAPRPAAPRPSPVRRPSPPPTPAAQPTAVAPAAPRAPQPAPPSGMPAAPSAANPAAGGTSVQQLMGLLQNPAIQGMLTNLLGGNSSGATGGGAVSVGGTQVPVGAILNTFSQLFGGAAQEMADAYSAETPDYLIDAAGQYTVDPNSPWERAQLVAGLLANNYGTAAGYENASENFDDLFVPMARLGESVVFDI